MAFIRFDPERVQKESRLLAREWLEASCLFLDTETTGLGRSAEICEIALLETNGQILIQTLVRPTQPIPYEVTIIHGISDEDVADAPTFREVWEELKQALEGRPIIAYNAPFDERMLFQSAQAHGINWLDDFEAARQPEFNCAMKLYRLFQWERRNERGVFGRKRLVDAATHLGIAVPYLHRAWVDAELCRQVVIEIACSVLPHPARLSAE